MSTNTGRGTLITCPQCGTRGIGRFCSNCGSPLRTDDESISGEIQSKFTTPLTALFSFLKTIWLILVFPRTFFKSYTTGSPPLSQLTFPLAGVWQLVSSKPQKVMGPFQSLGAAIGLAAVIAALQQWANHITGFGERVTGMSEEQVAALLRNMNALWERKFEKQLTIIDTSHLTGIAFVDGPAHEIITLLQYTYFPLVVSVFLSRAIRRSVLVNFYVYAASASLAVSFVFGIARLIVFLLLQGVLSLEALGVLTALPEMAGAIAGAYFVVILPVLVLPNVLPVTRGRMVAATLVGGLAWVTASFILTQLLLFGLGVLWY